MPRAVRDSKLDSRAARERLKPRGKPYWRALDPGLHIGYRRLKRWAGTWSARYYLGDTASGYEIERIAAADDFSGANDVDVLDWTQAQNRARALRDAKVRTATGKGPFTVADAIELYLAELAGQGRKIADTERRARSMILPALGAEEVAKLTTEKLRAWHRSLATTPARIRTARGEEQRYRAAATDDESVRRRQSTANRHWAILRAALEHAFNEEKTPSADAWRRVKPFKDVSAARIRYLTVAEAKRLINASQGTFRHLVQAALQTGARYSELARFKAADFNPDTGTIAIGKSKTGKSRHVVLTEEGAAFFTELCAGHRGGDLLLRQPNGEAWRPSSQTLPLMRACHRAGITPPANFHSLRHTYASLAIMAGAPLHVVGKNLGHVDTRMVEKHYGHLAPSYVADEIRKAAPRFGFTPNTKIRSLGAPK